VSPIVPPLCELLDAPENGFLDCSFVIEGIPGEGDTCIYLCDDGFTIQGDSVRECQSNGSWSGSEPTCNRGKSLQKLTSVTKWLTPCGT